MRAQKNPPYVDVVAGLLRYFTVTIIGSNYATYRCSVIRLIYAIDLSVIVVIIAMGNPPLRSDLTGTSPTVRTPLHIYEHHILLPLVNTTAEDVSRKERLAYDLILGIVDRHIQAEVDWSQHTELGTLGLDEIALK